MQRGSINTSKMLLQYENYVAITEINSKKFNFYYMDLTTS